MYFFMHSRPKRSRMAPDTDTLRVEYVAAMVIGAVVNFYVSYAVAHLVQWGVGYRHLPGQSLFVNQLRFLVLFTSIILMQFIIPQLLHKLPAVIGRPQWQTPQLRGNFFSGWAYAIVLGSEMISFFAT